MTTATSQETIELDYQLYDLPTAQHKAGLAGLVFLIRNLQQRRISPLPEILELTPVSLRLRVTQAGLLNLFNELYDACLIESASKQLRKNKAKEVIEPLRIEEKPVEGKAKPEKLYIYQDPRPKGRFLADYFPGDFDSPWLKLWRDMLWGTLRGIPATRGVYEERIEQAPSSEALKLWEQLLKIQKPKFQLMTNSVASSIYVGGQDVNAEQVPYLGLIAHNLLLHFWSLVSLVFVPQRFKPDTGGTLKSEYAGYVLAIPEIADLASFLEVYQGLLGTLDPEIKGYRPRDALVTLPEEAGMEYLYQMVQARLREGREQEIQSVVNAIELYHLEKPGNSLKILATEKVVPKRRWMAEYEHLRRDLHNPFFKTKRLKNLLQERTWHDGMDALLSQYPWEWFLHTLGKTPRNIPYFSRDVDVTFKNLINDLKEAGSSSMELSEDKLARSVYGLIREYARVRSRSKSGLDTDDYHHPKYREAREAVCRDAFLAMRGRRDEEFIEYFTGTICAVPQFLREDDFVQVSQALLKNWETVKTLSMLALSAQSYLPKPKSETEKGDAA